MPDQLMFHGRIVLSGEVITGSVVTSGETITVVDQGTRPTGAIDLGGDLLIPGLVELHTDHLENHLHPRPKVNWPVKPAILSFDAQVAASGITTVFDCVRAGHDTDYAPHDSEIIEVVTGIAAASREGILRADHKLHVRCEICAPDVMPHAVHISKHTDIALMSLMDHTPGARQFVNLDAWRIYYGGKSGRTAAELDELITRKKIQFDENYQRNRTALVEIAHGDRIALASHDDATPEHVAESIRDRVALAEFPTTIEAARLSHEAGIHVLMGAPNVVRGGSHSGNIASEDLARAGILDTLSSDYVPSSLLLGAFDLVRRVDDIDLASAIRMVSHAPARAVGLTDRGEIAVGKRADLVRVQLDGHIPIVREVYRGGRRVV
ncbi:MAG: alpha-D-ribose 1-methylphosphonate 5-triphosphate diphosphatase [Pseudomonadota bacterium]